LRAANLRGIRPISPKRISAYALAALVAAIPPAGSAANGRVDARSSGSDVATARRIASALLTRPLPAQLLRVRCDRVGAHVDCGLIVSGVKFHRALDVNGWNAEIAQLIAPAVEEIDCWATVPIATGRGVVVSGDFAQPAVATVFSITVPRAGRADVAARLRSGRGVFWDPAFRASLAKAGRQ
jgi:hypothetical protein